MNKSSFPASWAHTRSTAFAVLLFALNATLAAGQHVKLITTPDDGIQPQAAVDSKGVVHLIYFKGEPRAGDIFYAHREPGQKEFSKPIQVNTQPHTVMAMGTIRGAQLAVGKNERVHVVWDGMGEGASNAHASAHARPAHDSSTHEHPLHDPSAHVRPTHDAAESHSPLFYTRLNDAGTAFEPERNVITYAWGLDGGSSVAADPEGNVYVAWHAPKPGNTNGQAGRAVFLVPT